MDSLTHIVVGACIGEAMAGKSLGKKAMLWGAIMSSAPDIDFVTNFWMSTTDTIIAHRAWTHSLIFLIFIPWAMSWLAASRWHKTSGMSFQRWFWFFFVAVLTHLFLDLFNNYGVALFTPFSDRRFTWNVLYVADPLLTIAPLMATISLVLMRSSNLSRHRKWKWGLSLAGVYLIYALCNKWQINKELHSYVQQQEEKPLNYFTTPAPFQTWLWFTVVKYPEHFKIGYRSVFDTTKNFHWRNVPQDEMLLIDFPDTVSIKKLKQFSQGYYSIEKYGDTLVFNDFRFGQEIGWQDSLGRIAFHYYLNYPDANALVVQRGRFARWDMTVFKRYMLRVFGKM